MGSEGMQITIPDFDDDEYSPTPIFGRSQAGGLWGIPSSGQESPTILTPLAIPERTDKSYFHARGDSVASEDSGHSIPSSARKVKSPFVHSAQSSIATTSTSPFTKKTSFASLRNAFKSSKSNDTTPPPVPSLDPQAYPALKNPFNRSTSSLAQLPSITNDRRHPSMHASPPHFRPSTPASGDGRARGTPKSKSQHAYARSQHSHSGSIFHSSDGGSDHGHGYPHLTSSSPPPVPPVPDVFGNPAQPDERSLSDLEDRIVMDPRTPSDYALHAIFIRFAASAELHIDEVLQQPLEREPRLTDFMGPGVDDKLDDLLASLGKIAHKHAKPVIDSVMRWRKTQNDSVSTDLVRHHLSQPSSNARGLRSQDVSFILNERRSLASIYIMCRALIAATQSISKDGLGEAMGHSLEELTFEQFRRPDVKMLTQSVNHRSNADLYAALLGNLATVRFESVTDRFLVELGPVAAGQVPKDADFKYENLVKGLKHVQIKVWPPEYFEEGAEFLAKLSKSFENAHGNRLKTTFGETLVHLLHPIAKTAQAEVNHPDWAKGIEVIYPKAKDMMSKPRYWHVAYPLAITALCVAPNDFFLRHWNLCFEAGLSKIKEKPYRTPVLNGLMRLIWTYLYRCHESASTATSKMESILKHFFPANRLSISPQEDQLEPFIYIVHFVLSRHLDFGSDFCMELIQERSITAHSANTSNTLAPERIIIAIQSVLLSLHVAEREESAPSWPTSTDFSRMPSNDDYPSCSESIPAALLSKPGWKEFIDRFSTVLKAVAISCYQYVGKWSAIDDQWAASRVNLAYDDATSFVMRHHPEGSVAYPTQYIPHITVLQTIYRSWPRCLHPSFPIDDALDMLLRGVVHIEPGVGEAAAQALQRFMAEPAHASAILSRFYMFLFDPALIAGEGSGLRLHIECPRLLNLWLRFVDQWMHDIIRRPVDSLTHDELMDISLRMDEIEAGSLFLLAHFRRNVYTVGVKAIRLLRILASHLQSEPQLHDFDASANVFRIVDALHGKIPSGPCLDGHDDVLEPPEVIRLEQWKQSTYVDAVIRLADSDHVVDRQLWRQVFPAFLQVCTEQSPRALHLLRDKLISAATRYHPLMLQLSGVNGRSVPNLPQRSGSTGEKDLAKVVNEHKHLIQQWHMWVKIISATAQTSDVRPTMTHPMRDHSRARSEVIFDRDQMSTTRGLFKYLSQFLDSDHTIFRDVAVCSISSFPPFGYSHLLEDLSILAARQIYDDSRAKTSTPYVIGRTRRQERFDTAVARIYYLTARSLQDQRSSGKQTALAHVLKYVRNMQVSLSEQRDFYSIQRLRRYFCGTVERLFEGLATLKDSDRFIPPNMHLTLYRLCEEWCQLGKQSESVKKRLVFMQTQAVKAFNDPADQAELITRFQTETRALSNAAVGAIAVLCQKALFPPDISSTSPVEKYSQNYNKALEVSSVLDRITAILASFHEHLRDYAKYALRSLLSDPRADCDFLDEVLKRAYVTTKELDTSNARFFEVVAEVICNAPTHGFSFRQVVCLGLSNLCHPHLEIRRHAFNMLEVTHEQASGLISMVQYETAVGSSAPSVYLHAHKLISDVLAGEHPGQAFGVLFQLSSWITRMFDDRSGRSPLLLLQSLEYWVPNIDLMADDKSSLTREGRSAIYHLMALTVRYAESHAEQILQLWTRLVDAPHQTNGHASIRFLLEQSNKVGSTAFITCAAKVVACLSQSTVGRQIFEDLCSLIEPARMLPNLEHKLAHPDAEDIELWSDLDVLFSEQPRLSLGVAQFSLLFLSEAAMERYWELHLHLPALLHALFMHLDHRSEYIRERSRHMLFQLLRSCMSGYDEIPDRLQYRSRSELRGVILTLSQEAETKLWEESDSNTQVELKMRWFSGEVLKLLEPLYPDLREGWGKQASAWGTACSIRPIAFKSLQLYRALAPRMNKDHLGALIGRLSATVADGDSSIQMFNVELILSLISGASARDLNMSLLPQIFWCAIACLSTTVEDEFCHVLKLLDTVLRRMDLDDAQTAELLLAHKPLNWDGPASLQPRLLTGLRSSSTYALTFKLLQYLAKVDDPRLIDLSEGRVRDLYTLSLPWCLHAMNNDDKSQSLLEFALDVGRLANLEERPSIERIMTSFAKNRFRTKEDFLRQSVASLREHYGLDHWPEVVTLLMGMILNKERWLRIHTMQILKVLFQQREIRNPLLGSELLMPLLRLLETDLASQALDVLDEPMQISGGPAAKHILRMSLYTHLRADAKEVESVAEVFGIPQESGWCVPQSSHLRDVCRANVAAVFGLNKANPRPSRIDFQPDDIVALSNLPMEDDLGDMVQNLHELSSFFLEERSLPGPTRQLEARVAAILAKSTDTMADIPQTPFVDVFDMGNLTPFDDSEDSDNSDIESDLFEFDSLNLSRYNSNHSQH
ncbi:hypothetical protein SCP_1100060 [Sparassis crispa]|uniref:Cell morphogenesis protein n=1 Tax=Sparassis crispa TaxID=139825 RepID=A0A401GYU6_9APHY|nr:hypothetical protein SCP_1100060 [Sparassis crispa]GBE87331.1 hypothetical protein SCP_1100060 [Sparassis crispa]